MAKVRFNKMFLSSRHLKTELKIAFGLILISILVFLGYLFPGASSLFIAKDWLSIVVIIALFITVVGFVIILQIVNPIIKICNEAKLIADGNLERELEMAREDEIGELGTAINQMTRRIRDNVEELQVFSKKTESVNAEINRRVVMLTSLVEISNLIAQNADLEAILRASVDKCLEFGRMSFSCLVLKNMTTGEFKFHMVAGKKAQGLIEQGFLNVPIKLGKGVVGKTILKQNVIAIDKNTTVNDEVADFKNLLLMNNAVLAPITSKGNVFGVLLAANEENDYEVSAQEKELFYLIAKQVAIGVNNDLLTRELEKLEVTDHLTGLFNNTFTRKRLTEDIKRSASLQKPCSFVIFAIDRFSDFTRDFGHIPAENMLIRVASIFKESVTGTEKAARFGDHEFALILPGRNKRESIRVADEIRKGVERAFAKEIDPRRKLTCTGAITENPIDGVTAEELILRASVILSEAMQKGGNSIVF